MVGVGRLRPVCWLAAAAVVAGLVVVGVPGRVGAVGAGTWTEQHPNPIGGRMWHAAAVLRGGPHDGDAIICGGVARNPWGNPPATSRCDRFDTETEAWTQISPPGAPAVLGHSFDASGFEGRAVLFGGTFRSLSNPGQSTWLYNSAANTFTLRTPAVSPPARAWHGHAALPDGRVVIFGGSRCNFLTAFSSYSCALGDTWIYDETAGAQGSWTRIDIPGPPARIAPAMATTGDGRGVLYGGGLRMNKDVQGDTWIFDPSVPSWTQLPTTLVPAGLYNVMGATLSPLDDDTFLLSCGFSIQINHMQESRILDLPTATWTRVDPTVWTGGGRDYQVSFPSGPGEVIMHGGWGNGTTFPMAAMKFTYTPS
jgi:hypothetical protein